MNMTAAINAITKKLKSHPPFAFGYSCSPHTKKPTVAFRRCVNAYVKAWRWLPARAAAFCIRCKQSYDILFRTITNFRYLHQSFLGFWGDFHVFLLPVPDEVLYEPSLIDVDAGSGGQSVCFVGKFVMQKCFERWCHMRSKERFYLERLQLCNDIWFNLFNRNNAIRSI